MQIWGLVFKKCNQASLKFNYFFLLIILGFLKNKPFTHNSGFAFLLLCFISQSEATGQAETLVSHNRTLRWGGWGSVQSSDITSHYMDGVLAPLNGQW